MRPWEVMSALLDHFGLEPYRNKDGEVKIGHRRCSWCRLDKDCTDQDYHAFQGCEKFKMKEDR